MALDDWAVEDWLEKAGLSEWATAFNDNGYDTPELCASLSAEALDAIGVRDKMHREALFTQAAMLKEAMELSERREGLSSSGEAAYSAYSEPWSSEADKPQSRGAYSEPWTEGGPGLVVGIRVREDGMATRKVVDGGVTGKPVLNVTPAGVDKVDGAPASASKSKRKVSGDKVKGKPSRQRAPKLPVSPTPLYQKEGALTKLQLKLKIRDELQKDGIIPYYQKVRSGPVLQEEKEITSL